MESREFVEHVPEAKRPMHQQMVPLHPPVMFVPFFSGNTPRSAAKNKLEGGHRAEDEKEPVSEATT